MLKLVCSYSRKGPGDEEYSSRQYHAGLEQELPEGLTQAQLDAKVHETFVRLRDVVEAELSTAKPGNGHDRQVPTPANGTRTTPAAKNGNGRKISNAQAKFALDLARKAGLKLADVDTLAHDKYGAVNLYDLAAGQASELIEHLKARQAA